MNKFSQDSSCDVNVNCAINVLKFRFGRFQNIVTRTSRSMYVSCYTQEGAEYDWDSEIPLLVKLKAILERHG